MDIIRSKNIIWIHLIEREEYNEVFSTILTDVYIYLPKRCKKVETRKICCWYMKSVFKTCTRKNIRDEDEICSQKLSAKNANKKQK